MCAEMGQQEACLYASDALRGALQPSAQLLLLLVGLLYELVGVLHSPISVGLPPCKASCRDDVCCQSHSFTSKKELSVLAPQIKVSSAAHCKADCMTGQTFSKAMRSRTMRVREAMSCIVNTLTLIPNLSSSCGRSSPS